MLRLKVPICLIRFPHIPIQNRDHFLDRFCAGLVLFSVSGFNHQNLWTSWRRSRLNSQNTSPSWKTRWCRRFDLIDEALSSAREVREPAFRAQAGSSDGQLSASIQYQAALANFRLDSNPAKADCSKETNDTRTHGYGTSEHTVRAHVIWVRHSAISVNVIDGVVPQTWKSPPH